ncbi:MAG TPA: hypothetical protein VLB44_03105 [Kofleriaceae bacterium]|nr:hypothetical protein [Kofleriaceae bacterium]
MRHNLSFALLLAATSAACVDNASTAAEDTATVSAAIERSNGGFETTDEAPMFDQQTAFQTAAIEADAPASDPMASDPSVTAIANATTTAGHRVLIAWGHMPADPNAMARDWSGSLTLSRGGMVVGRTIGFEPLTDRVLPRTSKDVIEFESVTKPFADGLLLRILDPDPASTDPLTLTYHSKVANQDYTLDLAQLATGPLSIDAGDGKRVVAIELRDHDCEHGFLRGRWRSIREGLGVYRGMIANADGEVTGHIRGVWGQRENGERVMFGKFIATDGSFRGLVVGTYDAGHFRAKWLTAAGEHGVLGGMYIDSPNVAGGVFAGRWADASCAQP